MNTTLRHLVTIVAEPVIEHKLLDDLKRCGAKGYSVGPVHGEGRTGNRSLDLTGPSIRVETVVTEKVAEQIMEMLAEHYFDLYATVAWVCPVYVARPSRF